MEIYLFRHGIAEDAAPGSPDSGRQLTDEGREKAAAVVRAAKKAGVQPSLILSSPYARAHQTARIAAKEFGYAGEVTLLDSLVPHGTPERVWQDIRDYTGEPAILLAGHQPLMSTLAAFLLNAPSLRVDMKKSAMVRIDVDFFRAQPYGILRWMTLPRLSQ